jgi:tRNA threonylcarbamoyladenosine modification (KEOPS) complex  Pcc1 subunit
VNASIKSAEAAITLNYPTKEEAEAIIKSLSPDNLNLKSSSSIESNRVNSTVKLEIRCNRIETLLATIDDLLRCLRIAEETINFLNGKSR